VNIFGDAIYKTGADEDTYKEDLLRIKDKYRLDMVSFKGKVGAREVYNQTDILIHSSIEKEPFGRIVLEAMGSGIPVLSTGIGGTSEIYEGLEDLTFKPYDYQGLYNQIEKLVNSDTQKLRSSLLDRYKLINEQGVSSFVDFMGDTK
jgi:glycosyltransferase involved in cell wall biosynthesis